MFQREAADLVAADGLSDSGEVKIGSDLDIKDVDPYQESTNSNNFKVKRKGDISKNN